MKSALTSFLAHYDRRLRADHGTLLELAADFMLFYGFNIEPTELRQICRRVPIFHRVSDNVIDPLPLLPSSLPLPPVTSMTILPLSTAAIAVAIAILISSTAINVVCCALSPLPYRECLLLWWLGLAGLGGGVRGLGMQRMRCCG